MKNGKQGRSLAMLAGMLMICESARGANINVLMFGNSYSHGGIDYLPPIAAAAGDTAYVFGLHSLPQDSAAAIQAELAGTNLWTFQEALTNSVVAELSAHGWVEVENSDGGGYTNRAQIIATLTNTAWDYITFQPHSVLANNLAEYYNDFLVVYQAVTNYAPNAKFYLYETTQYRNDALIYGIHANNSVYDRQRGTNVYTEDQHWLDVHEAVNWCGTLIGVTNVIPGGTAVQNARYDSAWMEVFPDPDFVYENSSYTNKPDETKSLHVGFRWVSPTEMSVDCHPNNIANYLTGCVFYEQFFGKSCLGNSYVASKYTSADCAVMQRVAHETVQGKLSPAARKEIVTSITNMTLMTGTTNLFTFKLNEMMPTNAPSTTVTVYRASGSTNVQLGSVTSFVMTASDYMNPRTVSVVRTTAAVDSNDLAVIMVKIPSINLYVPVSEGAAGLLASPELLQINEGASGTFTLLPSTAPAGAVTVAVSRVSGTTSVDASPSQLIFTAANWTVPQTVTVSVAEDAGWQNDTAVIRCTAPGLLNAEVTVTALDNDINPALLLPFSETFDSTDMATNAGALNGQHGWISGTNAVVQSGTVYSGTQALKIKNDTAVHTFANGSNHVIFSWRAMAVPGVTPSVLPTNASAVIWVSTNDSIMVYSNQTAVTLPVKVSSNVWNLFEVDVNYASNVWKLSVNGTNAADNLALYSAQSSFAELNIQQSELGYGYVDDLSGANFGAAQPSALDNWLIAHYGSTNVDVNAVSSNGVNTILETYIAGLDPTNPASVLLISDLHPLTSANVFQWQGVSGRVYTVYWSSNLLSGFQLLESNVPWIRAVFTDAVHQAEDQGFYKIKVQIQ